jgi:aryl-alcohol dehydrogenase-like predicted oxidoreductase
MNYRKLGATGLTVSAIGLGCNRLGEDDRPDTHWIELVRTAADLGVNIFDTSEIYQKGGSEEVIGRALGNRDDVCIASKGMPKDGEGNKEFSAAALQKSAEASLHRLRRDCIDVYQLHSPNREELERFDWAEGLARLKEQGKIRFGAVAVNNTDDGIWLVEGNLVDALQITYNIFDTSADQRLFDLSTERGVALLGRLPMAQGILTGKFSPGGEIPPGHRALMAGNRRDERIGQAEALRPIGSTYPGGMARMALHFSLQPSAISCIIPGARTLEQLRDNVAAAAAGDLPSDIRRQIEQVRKQW